jgi:hypothetical protein
MATEQPHDDLLDRKFARAPHVFVREFQGELVVLDLDGGEYFGLDEVGHQLWKDLVDGQTIRQACDALLPRYDVARDTLEADLVALAKALLERRLLRLDEGEA